MKTGAEVLEELREAERERRKGRKVPLKTPPSAKLLVCSVCDQPGGTMVDGPEGKRHPDCEVATTIRKRAANKLRRMIRRASMGLGRK